MDGSLQQGPGAKLPGGLEASDWEAAADKLIFQPHPHPNSPKLRISANFKTNSGYGTAQGNSGQYIFAYHVFRFFQFLYWPTESQRVFKIGQP